jgi:anti-sigma factor RsiW
VIPGRQSDEEKGQIRPRDEMEHIKTADIISFVTATALSERAVQTAGSVTEHIRTCPKCFARVKDFQDLADGLFSMALARGLSAEEADAQARDEIERVMEEFGEERTSE